MSKNDGPWHDGRRAWERLNGWFSDPSTRRSNNPAGQDDGESDGALKALLDVALLRHLLDQAELIAVRSARRQRKSWAEIATKLGVTRQSAWERWRDLDEEAASESSTGVSTDVLDRTAKELRRRSSVVVPNVIGMTWDTARKILMDKTLVAVGPDPDGPPLGALGWPNGVVTDQSPEAGAKVPPGSPVTVWLDRGGGGSGVREPRRPSPAPKTAREMRYQTTDEPVS